VLGDTSVSMGDNPSTLVQDTTLLGQDGVPTATATFNGNISVTQGSGVGNAFLSAGILVGGNVSVSLNEGDNNFGINSAVGFNPTISGNLTVTTGNGSNNIGVNGTIAGNMTITLGNSTPGVGNFTSITAPPAGLLTYRSGNGPDLLVFVPPAGSPPQTWVVDVLFGSDDDTFALIGVGGTLTGRVDGGGRVLGNTFAQGPGWTLSPNLFITNFP